MLGPFCPRPGIQKRLGSGLMPYYQFFILQDFAEFFAELCAIKAPIVPIYSSLLH